MARADVAANTSESSVIFLNASFEAQKLFHKSKNKKVN